LLELINECEGDMGTVRDDEVEYKGRFIIPYKSLRVIRRDIIFPTFPHHNMLHFENLMYG
jgi:hypothetical protein